MADVFDPETIRRCARVADEWLKPGVLQLRGGEMTAQESRTVKAVVISIAAAIRALPSSPPGWRDIASAPRDGTAILLLSKEYSDEQTGRHPPKCAIGRWDATGDSWCDGNSRYPDDPEVDDDSINLHVTGVWLSGGGWFQPNEVTHWQPLPDPPTGQGVDDAT